MALFGSNKPRRDWGKTLATFFYGTDYMDSQDRKAAAHAEQQRMTALADRYRAALSPADGPDGSGTGAMPSIDQQMAIMDEMRLVAPELAERFAPVVEARAREQDVATLFANDPKAAMLYRSGNQSFLDSLGEQYKPQVIGAGGRQSVYGEGRTVDAPSFMQFGNQVQRNDPGSGQSVTVARRQPDPVNVAPGGRLLNPETGALVGQGAPRVFSASDGAILFDESGAPIAENVKDTTGTGADRDLVNQADVNSREVIPTINAMRQALRSGDVITGFGAEARLQAARALAATGNRDAQRQVQATEAYLNMSGRLRVGMAKSLGPNPSDADMRILQQVTAGNIGQNAGSLLSTLDQGYDFASQRQSHLQGQIGAPAGASGQPRRINSPAEYQQLPSGATFIAPDGSVRRKP